LNGTGAPGLFIGTLTDGTSSWLAVEWRVFEFGQTDLKVFQTWIGLNGTEDISYAYDPAALPGPTAVGNPLTVGAENLDGSAGGQITGPPTEDLRVTSTPGSPGGTVSYSFTVQGATAGTGTVTTKMTSPAVYGQAIAVQDITVSRR
ncbi:MAG: serine protease, partial [Nakamurella sp.]